MSSTSSPFPEFPERLTLNNTYSLTKNSTHNLQKPRYAGKAEEAAFDNKKYSFLFDRLYDGSDNDIPNDPYLLAIYVSNMRLNAIERQSNWQFQEIKRDTDRARNTQDMANRVDELIAEAAKGDDKTREKLPDDVIKYMRDNGIKIDGMSIDDYIKKNGARSGSDDGTLDKGQLQAVKAALDSSASRDTDQMNQQQLAIEKVSQQLSAAYSLVSNLIKKWGDVLSSIIRSIV